MPTPFDDVTIDPRLATTGGVFSALALLPGLGTRYAVPKGATAGTRAEFGIPEDALRGGRETTYPEYRPRNK